jgi:hypothetical protein
MNVHLISILIIIGVVAVIWYVTTTIIIFETLRKRNIKVNFLFLKFFAPIYAQQYKEITLKETGKVGFFFYHWIISINVALIVVILLIINKLI